MSNYSNFQKSQSKKTSFRNGSSSQYNLSGAATSSRRVNNISSYTNNNQQHCRLNDVTGISYSPSCGLGNSESDYIYQRNHDQQHQYFESLLNTDSISDGRYFSRNTCNVRSNNEQRISNKWTLDSHQSSNDNSYAPATSTLPQPPQHWLLRRTESLFEEDNKESSLYTDSISDGRYFSCNSRNVRSNNEQIISNTWPLNSPQPSAPMTSTLPQPPRHWLFGRAKVVFNEDENEFISNTDSISDGRYISRNSPNVRSNKEHRISNTWTLDSPQSGNGSTCNAPATSTLPQPPQTWLFGRAEAFAKEDGNEEEQELAKKTNTFDYYNWKMLQSGEINF